MNSEMLAVVVNQVTALIAEIRRRGDAFEDVQVPQQELRRDGARVTYVTRRQIRRGLLHVIGARERAALVGNILARHVNVAALANDAGPTPEWANREQLVGLRYLDRLVNAVIAGKDAFPRDLPKRIGAIADAFNQQLAAATVTAEWVYPLIGCRIEANVVLGPGVTLRRMSPTDLADLERHEVGAYSGATAAALILNTTAALYVRRSIPAPGTYYRSQENEQLLRHLGIAVVLVGLRPLQFVVSWVRPAGPSVFAVEGGEWAIGSFSLGSTTTLSAPQLRSIVKALRLVQKCPESVRSSLSVQRLLSSGYRSQPADLLVDVWVGLEALLMMKEENTELQYRMSLRAARLLRIREPRSFINMFKKAYNDRSKQVHGSGGSWDQGQRERLQWSQDILRRLVTQAIRRKTLPDCIALEDEMIVGRPARGSAVAASD